MTFELPRISGGRFATLGDISSGEYAVSFLTLNLLTVSDTNPPIDHISGNA